MQTGGSSLYSDGFTADKALSAQELRSARERDLYNSLASMVDPRSAYKNNTFVAPPFSGGERSTTLQNREIYGNFRSSPSPGAVVARFMNGVNSIIRLAGIQPATSIPDRANPSTGYFPCGLTGLEIITSGETLFVATTKATNVQLEPDLTRTATYGRSLACALCVYSDATSTTAAAMSGTLTAASVSDLRSVPNFASATLRMSTVNKKDGVSAVKVQEGVVLVQGPDVKVDVGIIDPTVAVVQGVSGIALNVNGNTILDGNNVSIAQPYASSTNGGFGAAWISFCSRAVSVSTGINPPANFTIQYPALDDVSLKITAQVEVAKNASLSTAYPPVGAELKGVVTTVAYYASVDPSKTDPTTGAEVITITTSVLTHLIQDVILPQPWVGPITNQGQPEGIAEKLSTTGYIVTSSGGTNVTMGYVRGSTTFVADHRQADEYRTYIGTFVSTSNSQMGTGYTLASGNTSPTTIPATSSLTMDPGFVRTYVTAAAGGSLSAETLYPLPTITKVTNIDAIAKNLYNEHLTGPARVVTWENVATGQNVLVCGCQICEIVVGSVVTPFFQRANAVQASASNYWSMMTAAFNSTSKIFNRVYMGADYKRVTEEVLPYLGLTDLLTGDKKLSEEVAKYIGAAEPTSNAIQAYAEGNAFESKLRQEVDGMITPIQGQLEQVAAALQGELLRVKQELAALRAATERQQIATETTAHHQAHQAQQLQQIQHAVQSASHQEHPLAIAAPIAEHVHAAGYGLVGPMPPMSSPLYGSDGCYGADGVYGGEECPPFGGSMIGPYSAGSMINSMSADGAWGNSTCADDEECEAAGNFVSDPLINLEVKRETNGAETVTSLLAKRVAQALNYFFAADGSMPYVTCSGATPSTIKTEDMTPMMILNKSRDKQVYFAFPWPGQMVVSARKLMQFVSEAKTISKIGRASPYSTDGKTPVDTTEVAKMFRSRQFSGPLNGITAFAQGEMGTHLADFVRANAAVMHAIKTIVGAAKAATHTTIFEHFNFTPVLSLLFVPVGGRAGKEFTYSLRYLCTPKEATDIIVPRSVRMHNTYKAAAGTDPAKFMMVTRKLTAFWFTNQPNARSVPDRRAESLAKLMLEPKATPAGICLAYWRLYASPKVLRDRLVPGSVTELPDDAPLFKRVRKGGHAVAAAPVGGKPAVPEGEKLTPSAGPEEAGAAHQITGESSPAGAVVGRSEMDVDEQPTKQGIKSPWYQTAAERIQEHISGRPKGGVQ